jgi:cadmium resistance protein CadD (predicted permease)
MLGFLGFFPIFLGIKGFVELFIECYKKSSINIDEIIVNDDIYTVELEAIRYRNDINGQILSEITIEREQQSSTVDSPPSPPKFKQKLIKLLSHCCNLQILKVASITLANCSDNVAIYTPLFAQAFGWQIGVYIIIFLIMVFVWLIVSYLFINFRPILNLAQKYAHIIVPFVFIGLGIYIIVTSECFPWLIKAIQTKNFKNG